MKLIRALGLKAGETVAFVGAGGKTSALFALAQEWEGPVALTTTTHLGAWQVSSADRHVVPDDIDSLDLNSLQILLVTGPAGKDDRLMALDPVALARLHERCRAAEIPLLIEADGAKLRSLKAPAAREPVIPPWTDVVVVMAGLQGLGKPLTDEWVHRPALFAGLSGQTLGELIRVEDLIAVLGAPRGGLKGIPAGARRYLFLNQADDPLRMAQGNHIAQSLIGSYDRSLIGSLARPTSEGPIFAAQSRIAGVILAAGGSKRLGQPKQLLQWQGEPFITRIIKSGLEAGLAPLVVVTGAERALVEAASEKLPVQTVFNPDWGSGQASSMRAGLAVLPEGCDGALFLLSDQPQVSPLLIRQLLERFYAHRKSVTAPLIREQRGNPVLFSREAFDALRSVTGDQGGRAVIRRFEVDWLPWVDDRALLDVDQPEDLDRLREAYSG